MSKSATGRGTRSWKLRAPVLLVALASGLYFVWTGLDLAAEFSSSSSIEGVQAAALGFATAAFGMNNAVRLVNYELNGGDPWEFRINFVGGAIALAIVFITTATDFAPSAPWAFGALAVTQVALVGRAIIRWSR